MRNVFQKLWKEEDGMGTVEVVIIVAVLVGVALLFREQITSFVEYATGKVFDKEIIDDTLKAGS